MIKRFSDKDVHDHPELKCYMKCIMIRLNTMDETGKLNVKPVLDMIEKVDPWARDILMKMGSQCARIKFPKNIDLCEKAFKIHKCLKEADPVVIINFKLLLKLGLTTEGL